MVTKKAAGQKRVTLFGYGENHGKKKKVLFQKFQDDVVIVKTSDGHNWKFRAKDGFPQNVLGGFTGWQLDVRELPYL
jgi:hypothetical protein